jgi:DNA sulfur modification protein DndB
MKAFPTIKGKMGDWNYYLITMKMAELAKYVKFAEEVFPNDDLDQIMQRELTNRSKEIAAYLQNNEQRFLGSLIIAAVGGEPKFIPISLPEGSLFSEGEQKLGFLRFDGTENYYALDGQHRLAAIKDVINENGERYALDEVSLTLVWHENNVEGCKRARRLFTTVNRYAKKTNPTENLIFDEDNPVDIYTRRLVREHDFFKKRIKIANAARGTEFSLAKSEALRSENAYDNSFLMALLTLKRCSEILLENCFLKDNVKKQILPNFETLEAGYALLVQRWTVLLENVPLWKLLRDNSESNLATYRTKQGGNVLARPIGIIAFVTAATQLLDSGGDPALIKLVSERVGDITHLPWKGLLWKAEGGGMHDGQARRAVAAKVFSYYLIGAPTFEETTTAWEGVTGISINQALPKRDLVVAP